MLSTREGGFDIFQKIWKFESGWFERQSPSLILGDLTTHLLIWTFPSPVKQKLASDRIKNRHESLNIRLRFWTIWNHHYTHPTRFSRKVFPIFTLREKSKANTDTTPTMVQKSHWNHHPHLCPRAKMSWWWFLPSHRHHPSWCSCTWGKSLGHGTLY